MQKKNVSSNQSNVEALDELFATMNGLNDLIEQDNALVEDIKQVTSNLGNMDKSYNDNQKKHTNKSNCTNQRWFISTNFIRFIWTGCSSSKSI